MLNQIKKHRALSYIALLIIFAAIPNFIKDDYVIRIINMCMIYSIVALSINLIVGISGQLDMGRSAFLGVGAYASALLSKNLGVPFLPALILSGLICAATGWFLGFLCRKSTFDYLTLITIGFNAICQLLFLNLHNITGGAMGIRGVPSASIFGFQLDTSLKFFYFALALLILSYAGIQFIIKSKWGRAFAALRDDPIAAAYSGIRVENYKVLCFAVASFFTGIAGSALVHYTTYASPYNYTLDESIYELQMPILGGLGNLPGSIIGSSLLVIAPEISRTFYQYRLLFVGLLMVILMIWAPNGLLGKDGVGEKVIGIRHLFSKKKI
ncbi:branched-chain amino acid ABC transporter permease [Caproiciproducens sp.]